MAEGRIKKLTDKGFGFIDTGDGSDMFFHMSNLHAAPPNLGMEVFTVLVGYRLPR